MLFQIKLAEMRQVQQYIIAELSAAMPDAYLGLSQRLDYLRETWENSTSELDLLEEQLRAYLPRPLANDTFQNIFSRLRRLAIQLQTFVKEELPAYRTWGNEESYTLFLANMCQEVRVNELLPIVALSQGQGFATYPLLHIFPLVFLHRSVQAVPLDLALFYHELGHILYKKWVNEWNTALEPVILRQGEQKVAELATDLDVIRRNEVVEIIQQWMEQAEVELEELVCDIIGALVGGPAYSSALTRLMLGLGSTIFTHVSDSSAYPPVDYRIRATLNVLRHINPLSATCIDINNDWPRVRKIAERERPEFYNSLYDESYLDKVVAIVDGVLTAHDVCLYRETPIIFAPVRDRLVVGAELLHSGDTLYTNWQQEFAALLANLSSYPDTPR